MMKDNNLLLLILGLVIAGSLIFECAIIGISFFGADRVECNLLWCTFTTERIIESDSIIIKTHKSCFLNGYEIDCNDNRTNLPKITTDGNFNKRPIFKGQNEWIDILEVS